MTGKYYQIKSYAELKNESWFVEDMRRFCGMKTTILCEIDDEFVIMAGCGGWQFHKNGLAEIEKA